ncbi:S-layer homology domain-containing protein, partial [Patescibacteria group bacterium]|nr:S-layer homology domain-containing protein [Patescibacteria group bacterium]MBU1703052.1 S-layer homology domain-containing protein [Patescibacteria group bacterium]
VIMGGASVPKTVAAKDFVNGTVSFDITPTSSTGLQIEVKDANSISGQSHLMKSVMFNDVDTNASYYDAVSFLKENGVITGYPDGSFRPEAVVSRVESLKFILSGINSELISAKKLPFPDTAAKEWYSDYVVTAYNRAIVGGYPDNTFKPANTVNRAEFLKMLLNAMEINVDKSVSRDVYSDVPRDAWFAPYVQYAKDKNLISHSGGSFKPNEGMTRSEVADLIYRVIVLKISGSQKYSSGLKVSGSEVSAYFS